MSKKNKVELDLDKLLKESRESSWDPTVKALPPAFTQDELKRKVTALLPINAVVFFIGLLIALCPIFVWETHDLSNLEQLIFLIPFLIWLMASLGVALYFMQYASKKIGIKCPSCDKPFMFGACVMDSTDEIKEHRCKKCGRHLFSVKSRT